MFHLYLLRTFTLSLSRLNRSAILILFLVCAFFSPYQVHATSITVNTFADTHDPLPGDGIFGSNDTISIRAAIEECNAGTAVDRIIIPGTDDYQLSLGPLELSASGVSLIGVRNPSIDGVLLSTGSPILMVMGNSNSVTGITFRRSGGSAIVLKGNFNLVGSANYPNFFYANSLNRPDGAAIEVAHQARENVITANWIGIALNGTLYPNQIGIAVRGGVNTMIGRFDSLSANWISGNLSHGILVTDNSMSTQVLSNRIGLSASRISASGNEADGIRIEYSTGTNIGTSSGLGLLVSGNHGDGISITSGADSVVLHGVRIGTDLDSDQPFGNRGNGITIDRDAKNVRFDGPKMISSGNIGHGIFVSGPLVENLIIRRCHIGVSEDGFVPVANGLDGIHLENSRDVVIGDTANSNFVVVSGNDGYGIALTSGTSRTLVQNTVVGVTANGASSMPNRTGILIADGCHDNQIGQNIEDGNLISGNRGDIYPQGAGILLFGEGCESNSIAGNLIGTDGSGTRALRNGSAGIVILGGASRNIIGGTAQNQLNIIAGNGSGPFTSGLGRGIHISGFGSTGNKILGNRIGTSRDGLSALSNNGHGIGIFTGASETEISSGNLIAHNRGSGIFIRGDLTTGHRFSESFLIFNDSGMLDLDQNANGGKLSPILGPTALASGVVSGSMTSDIGDMIEFYLVRKGNADLLSRMKLIGSMTSTQSTAMPFSFPINAQTGDTILALATDAEGNTSEFSDAVSLDALLDVGDELNESGNLIMTFYTYPNPSVDRTTIAYSLPRRSLVDVVIYNLLGQKVRKLDANAQSAAATQMIEWDGKDERGSSVAAGLYFVRLATPDTVLTRKIQVVRTGL